MLGAASEQASQGKPAEGAAQSVPPPAAMPAVPSQPAAQIPEKEILRKPGVDSSVRPKVPMSGMYFKMMTFSVTAEGIADDKVSGVLADQGLKEPHLCLFRIETLSSQSSGTLTKTEAKLESKANKASFEQSQGAPLKFGDQVQMKHCHSLRFLSLNLMTAAATPGAWSVSVSPPNDFLCRKISLLPFNRSHNLGDVIKCDEPLSLVFQTENLRYYLQAEGSGSAEKLEIHSTHKPASWKFLRYETHDESAESIKFGVPVLIKYAKLSVLMALKKEKAKIVSSIKSGMRSQMSESVHRPPREIIVTKSEVEDYSNFWVLQNVNVLKGGCSLWGSKFVIKNALTGEFIGKNLDLQPEQEPGFFFTFPKPEAFRDDSLIPYGYHLLLKSSDGRILSVDQKKSNEEALDHLVPVKIVESQYDSGDIKVTLEPLAADKRESLFVIDVVAEGATRFFNLIKGLLPKFYDIKIRLDEFAAMKDEEGRKVWEAAEVIQKKLETTNLALSYVLQAFRGSSGEERQVNQRIFTGLKFHAVLIDIASVLHITFGPESTHGASSFAYEQLFQLANQNVEVLWDLLMDSILENYHAAKLMADHQIKLCKLLKFDTRRIGGVLTEVFRLVDPEIKDPKSFYREWCSRLETLGRKNLTEQVIYIKIIRNLCELGDTGVLEYQREVTWHLFNSDITFEILQFCFYQGEPAIHFGYKGSAMGVTEFNIRNPDLAPLFHEDTDGRMLILMRDLSTLPDYVEYVQAALMLYHCICRGKCYHAVELVGSRLGLTLPTIFTVSQDLSVHIDIRQACIFLLEALCITAPPFEPFTEHDTSFNYALLKVEESRSERTEVRLIEYNANAPYVSKILSVVFDFWMQKDLPRCIDVEGFVGPLNFLKAMLRVTLAAVNYQHCNELYFNFVLRAMHYVLAGFTESGSAIKNGHWSTSLISKAVKEGLKDRKLELLVNELLGCVLTTIIAIKKISRRTLLTLVVRLLISKPAVFKVTMFGIGMGASNAAEEVSSGLKGILDPARQAKMMIDYCKSCSKKKGKAGAADGLLEGDSLSENAFYEPTFDFKDIVNDAPSIKEVFIRVILEWFSFSSYLKDRMLEVMDEIFKEKELFGKCFKYVDVYSLGPISEMYNRLRWLRENSEINSLIIRARFECSMTGKSISLTRIGNLLEYIINFIHPNTCVSEFILRKTQNMIRHQEIHNDLYKLWGLVQFLDKIGKGEDSPAVRLKSAFTSFLYFFIRENSKNAKELAKMLQPQHYILTIAQYPCLLRLINDYAHINVRDFTRLLIYVLEEAQISDKNLCMLNFLENIIVDKFGGKKRTIQNLVSTMLSERVSEELRRSPDRSSYISRLIHNLSLSAEDNPPVIAQCRYMMPLSRLQDLFLKEESTEMLNAYLKFLNSVYIRKTKDIKTLEKVDDIKEIVLKLMKVGEECMKEPAELIRLVEDGVYPIVFFTRSPAYAEIHCNSPPSDFARLQRWSFLCFEWDTQSSGMMTLLPGILESLSLDYSIQRGLLSFFHSVSECSLKIKQMAERLDGIVNFSRILRVFHDTEEKLEKCLHNLGVTDTAPAFQQLLCEVTDSDVEHLKEILKHSFQFPLVSDMDVAVDEEVEKIVKAGFTHYKKISASGDEGEYITAFVTLIDSRLANGELTGRKEIKEAIPGLLRKIKRLQRLFTTSKQRTFFFHILQGICPKEELNQVKILLNPMFKEAEVTSYALTAIMKNETMDEVNASLLFLRKLFLMQTKEFMDEFQQLLDEGSLAYPLFMQIQKELDTAKASIIEKAKTHSEKQKELPKDLGMLTKLAAQTAGRTEDPNAGASKQQQMAINMLMFVQICCDNCNESFQLFFRKQENKEGKADVDMVLGITTYLIETRMVKDYLIVNKAVFQVLNAALCALVDFVTGPCVSNQTYLGNNYHVYLVMNTLISLCGGKEDKELIEIHQLCIQFLNTLLEGHPDPVIPENMSKFLDLAMMRTLCETVYETKVKGFERLLSLESDQLKMEHHGVVQATLNQAIIFVILRNKGVIHDELNKFEGTIAEPTPTYEFFSKYIGYVEIFRGGTLETNFFPIPMKCKYITPTTRQQLIQEVNRSSHQEKIEDFMHWVSYCLSEMKHQQFLYRFQSFKQMSERWQFFGKISYYIALVVNMTLLASISEPDFSDLKANAVAFLMVALLGIMQIIAYMACFFFNLVEYYPKALMSGVRKEKEMEMYEFHTVVDSDSQTMLRTHYMMQGHKKKTYSEDLQEKLQQVLLNFDMYYTYAYFMISIIAVYEPVFYPWLLLDMIKQTPELGNVLRAVTQNFKQLILTMWLGVILIYLFSIVSFTYYVEYYVGDNLYCYDLWNCFFTSLNMGIRSGGGIGDVLVTPIPEDYWARMVFDMLFYMIIIIILLNIIFGIIIDTFAELREGRSFMLNDILTVCYICGTSRSVIEMKGTPWSYHFMCEHSPFAYLSFFIYITEKKIYDCSGLEKHVKEKFMKRDASFMPMTSIAMELRDKSDSSGKDSAE